LNFTQKRPSFLPAPTNHSEEMGPLRTSKLCLCGREGRVGETKKR